MAIVEGRPSVPSCAPARPDETALEHGSRVLIFLLEHEAYGVCSDLELERAQLASQYFVSARDISTPALNRLHRMRHVLLVILAERKREQADAKTLAQLVQVKGGQLKGGPAPAGGDREPLIPRPKSLEPGGTAVRLPVPLADVF